MVIMFLGDVLGCLLMGVLYGLGLSLILYVLGFVIEIFGCAFHIITCNCNADKIIPIMWSWSSFGTVVMFCAIGGAVIGLFFGIFSGIESIKTEKEKLREEEEKRQRKQRKKWAEEMKVEADNAKKVCDENKAIDKPLISVPYYASNSQMDNILHELSIASELQGKVDAIFDELSKVGENR